MFYTVIDEYNISLIFETDNLILKCSPDCSEAVLDIGTTNRFDSTPPDGQFNFTWNDEVITFISANHTCGQAGVLEIKIKSSPEIVASLERAIDEIKQYVQNLENE